ncbi:MAG: hypothetical protein JJU29_12805 [Verrucomicrobia bacterium]|nr:hypothetical protein [Verrucomicrobiota bacterium]MCH8513345.1 hypothetical protein [Kiritimatiellia bacterium]
MNITREKAEKFAKHSWQLPLLILLLMSFLTSMIKIPIIVMILALGYLIMHLIGITFGILACCSVKTHGKEKILIPGSVGIVINVLLPALLIAIAIPTFHKARASAIHGQLHMAQRTISAQLPVMVDEMTRIDRVEVTGPREMTYTYTLVSMQKSTMDTAFFSRFIQKELQQEYDTSPKMEMFRKNDVTVNHVYRDEAGEVIVSLQINHQIETTGGFDQPPGLK